MPQHQAQPLHCPKCRYDLSGAAHPSSDEATCPECGLVFSTSILRTRAAALVSMSLAMIGWGALTVLVAEVFVTTVVAAIKQGVTFSGNQTIDGEVILERCQLLPQLFVACGVGILGWTTARTARQRMCSVAAGAALALLLLFGHAAAAAGWGWSVLAFANWQWQFSLNTMYLWALGLATWLAICAGAQSIGRAVRTPEAPAWRRVVLALCIIAGTGLCLTALLRGLEESINMNSITRVANQTKNYADLRRIQNIFANLVALINLMWWLAWLGVALAALVARTFVRARLLPE